jgi:hypothetical protein
MMIRLIVLQHFIISFPDCKCHALPRMQASGSHPDLLSQSAQLCSQSICCSSSAFLLFCRSSIQLLISVSRPSGH